MKHVKTNHNIKVVFRHACDYFRLFGDGVCCQWLRARACREYAEPCIVGRGRRSKQNDTTSSATAGRASCSRASTNLPPPLTPPHPNTMCTASSPEQLRPLEVLKTTARYLVRDVFAKACVQDGSVAYNATGGTPLQVTPELGSGGVVGGSGRRGSSSTLKAYLFVEDRLRAVRQDLTVQGLALTPGAAEVLKIAANFYVVSGYLLCDEVRALGVDRTDRTLFTSRALTAC